MFPRKLQLVYHWYIAVATPSCEGLYRRKPFAALFFFFFCHSEQTRDSSRKEEKEGESSRQQWYQLPKDFLLNSVLKEDFISFYN